MKFKIDPKALFNRMKQLKRKTWFLIGGGIVVFVIFVSMIIPSAANIATTEVQRGEFVIDLNTQGEIDALNSTNISAPRMRRWMRLQIVDMAEEGSIVKKGDFLLQLDTSEGEQKVAEETDRLENAKAQLESEKATIASNQAQLVSQLESQKYSYQQAELSLKMMQFEAEARKQEYELNMKKAEVALEQAEEQINSQKIIDGATIKKAELNVKHAEAELQEARQSLEKLTIRAPIDGLVVYKEIFSGSGMKKVQVGDTPFPGFSVMSIPDLSVMQAKTVVNEAMINQIEKGQNVVITVEALEGKAYYGKLTRVAALARREKSTNVKVFDVEVTLDSTDGQLRPGMTCDCRVITGRIQDALFVPLQSVFQKEDTTAVYIMAGATPRKKPVKVGAKSSDFIVIEDGLEEGDLVCLRDPTVPLDEIGTESQSVVAKPKKKPKPSRGVMIMH